MDIPTSVNSSITWEPKKIKVSELVANPQNPKITTEIGKQRLQKSLGQFGLAGSIVANLDLQIIDGHSRVQDALENGIEEVWVSLPSRQLTEEEYKIFNAMHDVAKAGEPDVFMMENMFMDEFLVEWGLKKEKKEQGEKGLFPIVQKFDEKHDAIIIVCQTESEISYIQNALMLEENSSYKNKNTGTSFVTTAKNFIKVWQSK